MERKIDPEQYVFSDQWAMGPDINLDEEVLLNPDGTRFTEADAGEFAGDLVSPLT